jgi:hypothetical protein
VFFHRGAFCIPVIFLFFPFVSFPLHSQVSVAASYIDKAKALNLSKNPYWRKLLHYERQYFTLKSTADSNGFFLSPDGVSDAEAELIATIQGIFSPIDLQKKDHHPRCKFIARTRWVQEQLGIANQELPEISCDQYAQFREKFVADSVGLVFSSYNVNSSASMFGHTFLRLKKKDGTSKVLNYLAFIESSDFLSYFFRGLSGGYHGRYLLEDYDQKIREYLYEEQRNLWELNLTLTPSEIEIMFRHLWELANTHFDYYFLSENCSYNLLLLLEIARPNTDIADYFRVFVHPADTVKVVATKTDLWTGIEVTFSATEQYGYYHSLMTSAERISFSEALEKKTIPDSPLVRKILQSFLLFKKSNGGLDSTETANLDLLTGKHINVPGMPLSLGNPVYAHETGLVATGGGVANGIGFTQLTWRPTLHDFLDSYAGYPPTMQLVLMETVLRYYPDKPRARFELASLDILNLVSLRPLKPRIFQFSYEVQTGFRPLVREFSEAGDTYFWFGQFGYGVSAELPWFHHVLLYMLPGIRTELGPGFSDYYRAGFYFDSGIIVRFSEYLSFLVSLQPKVMWGRISPDYFVPISGGLNLAFSNSLALENRTSYYATTRSYDTSLYLKYYF